MILNHKFAVCIFYAHVHTVYIYIYIYIHQNPMQRKPVADHLLNEGFLKWCYLQIIQFQRISQFESIYFGVAS